VDDYITCKIPDFRAYFFEMTEELANCRCRYEESPPNAAADISPIYSTSAQPVIYHDHLHLEVMNIDTKTVRFPFIKTSASGTKLAPALSVMRDAVRADANNNLGIAQLALHFKDGSVRNWQSNLFSSWQKDGFQIWAGFDAARYADKTSRDGWAKFLEEGGFWDEIQPEYSNGFLIWESEATARYDDEAMPAGFTLSPESIIYIGHNPDTNAYFNGTIRAVSVDPGCRGH
jgi:hypothetical protein